MSLFRRLGNVARGKVKELGRTLGEGMDAGFDGSDDPFVPSSDRDAPSSGARGVPATTDDKRAMLDRLLAEGLLTEEEHATKVAALEAPASPAPRKRHL
ncbi:MAG: hypothetical protein KC656_26030 [Myxococcales bacterium]|nr:hypothetical protein [Myxococcales bacterium]